MFKLFTKEMKALVTSFKAFQKSTGILREDKSLRYNKKFESDLNKFISFIPIRYKRRARMIIYKYLLRQDDVLTLFETMSNTVKNKIIIFIDKALIEDFVWECGYDITNIEQNYWGNAPKHNNGVDDTDKGLPQWYEPMSDKMKQVTELRKCHEFGAKFEDFIEDFED